MIFTDNSSISPLLYIVSLEEYYKNVISLIMHTMALIFLKEGLYNK